MVKKRTTVFIIEDNEADIFLIKKICRELDSSCNFIEAGDGETAIKLLETVSAFPSSKLPNFILLDLNLPKRSGLEVLEKIKADPVLKFIPVVIFSSSHSVSDIRRSYEKYANSYMIKPFDILEFERSISTMYDYWIESSPVAV